MKYKIPLYILKFFILFKKYRYRMLNFYQRKQILREFILIGDENKTYQLFYVFQKLTSLFIKDNL